MHDDFWPAFWLTCLVVFALVIGLIIGTNVTEQDYKDKIDQLEQHVEQRDAKLNVIKTCLNFEEDDLKLACLAGVDL